MAPATDNAVQVLTEAKSNNYQVVAFALDLTGKKFIDEICHISAYRGPNSGFDQYVMTYRDISRSSVRSHGIRIFTMFGKYRVLKDMNTMKTLHTKTEYSTLNDFVKWLSDLVKDSSSEGIILAFHDSGADKVTPFLMEALERHHLTEEFFKIVKGFVNCSAVASTHPDIKGRSLALRSLARRLLGEDEKPKKESISSDKDSDEQKTDAREVTTDSDGQKTDASEVATDSDGQKTDASEETTDSDEKDKTEQKDEEPKDKDVKKTTVNREKSKLRDKEIRVVQSAKFRALTTYKLLQKMTTASDDLFGDELLKFLSTKEEALQILERQRGLAANP